MRIIYFLILLGLFSCESGKKAPKQISQNIDSLLLLYPDSVNLLLKRGTSSLKEYDFKTAFADAAKAFRLDSNNLESRMLYANVLNNRPKRSFAEIALAQRHYKIVIKKEPKNQKALVGLASTYSQQLDFDNSFHFLNQALRVNPKYRDAYVMKGSNYLILNKPDLAKSSYETAIQQDPKFYEGYLRLGAIYQAENNVRCLEYYKSAVQLRPKDPEMLFALAYAQQLFEKPKEAIENYRKMYQLDTTYIAALNQIGVIKQYNYKDIDSAMHYYNSALYSEPRFVEAWHNLGTCFEVKGDVSRALQSYAKALKYNPNYTLSRERANALK